jgi:hypothetical protein
MSMSVRKPLARSQDLVIEELEDELLVYDRANNRAHCLGATAAIVWRACDGTSDVQSLSVALGLSPELVTDAVDELESLELLDGLHLVDGSGGITRREMTLRSMKAGGAIAAAPMIYSIVVPTAAAAATPTPFQCQIYTTQDCGASSGCGAVAGCCCCTVGCSSQAACKTCSSVSFCNAGSQECASAPTTFASKCSDSKGTFPANVGGCCSVSGASQCGCAFGVAATAGTGGPNGGSGCCSLSNPVAAPSPAPPGYQQQYAACTPGATNCVPCCNGVPLSPATATFGCCVPNPSLSTC